MNPPRHNTPAITDTRVFTHPPEPDLTDWLADTPHTLDGDQLTLHTDLGDMQPRPGWTLLKWDDGEITAASPRTVDRVYAPHGLLGRLHTAQLTAAHWHQAAIDRDDIPGAHAIACIRAALGGATDPGKLGIDHPDEHAEASNKPVHAPHEQYRYATTWADYHAGRRAALGEPKDQP